MLSALGDEFGESDLLKFNQLKFRRKAMIFGKQLCQFKEPQSEYQLDTRYVIFDKTGLIDRIET